MNLLQKEAPFFLGFLHQPGSGRVKRTGTRKNSAGRRRSAKKEKAGLSVCAPIEAHMWGNSGTIFTEWPNVGHLVRPIAPDCAHTRKTN